jgi:cyclic pyranopterin phosphate synthase
MSDSASAFSHLDPEGRARMVNVGQKPDLRRIAEASGFIRLQRATVQALRDQVIPKGDVLTVAKIAGIQAAKRTSELIPLCHSLPLHSVDLRFTLENEGIRIVAMAETTGKTGVEMEALTAVSASALTIYDMCKSMDKTMVIETIRLVSKTKSERRESA